MECTSVQDSGLPNGQEDDWIVKVCRRVGSKEKRMLIGRYTQLDVDIYLRIKSEDLRKRYCKCQWMSGSKGLGNSLGNWQYPIIDGSKENQ
jgi:hypothetical protein